MTEDQAAHRPGGPAGNPQPYAPGPLPHGPTQQPPGPVPHNQAPYYDPPPYSPPPLNQAPYNQAPYNQTPYNQAPQNPAPYNQGPYEPAPYNTVSGEQREIWATKGQRALIFGVLWIAGGLILSFATYSAASNGGVYLVAWGPVVYGIYQVVSGIVMLNKSKR